MRAREPDADGLVDRDGVKLHYEVFGDGQPTLLLLPTWTVVHSRFWKAQVPYLARHFRVVTYDGPGNGRSDRPAGPGALRLRGRGPVGGRGAGRHRHRPGRLVSLSMAADWALWLAASHPERVLGQRLHRPVAGPGPGLGGARRGRRSTSRTSPPRAGPSTTGYYWLDHYEDFLEFFFSQCFPEPHSTKQIEDGVGWGLETSPEVLLARTPLPGPTRRPCAPGAPPAAARCW